MYSSPHQQRWNLKLTLLTWACSPPPFETGFQQRWLANPWGHDFGNAISPLAPSTALWCLGWWRPLWGWKLGNVAIFITVVVAIISKVAEIWEDTSPTIEFFRLGGQNILSHFRMDKKEENAFSCPPSIPYHSTGIPEVFDPIISNARRWRRSR